MNALTATAANDDSAITVPAIIEPSSIMSKVIELASTPGINTEMVDRLIAWHEREQARQAMEAFNVAMSAAQGEIRAVVKNAYNDQTKSKFATLEAVDEAIRPIYTQHGFRVSFTETPDDAPEMRITCIVARGAHVENYSLPALADMTGPKGAPNKTQVQGVGSTVSYLRRYLTCLVFNVATRDDNDGNRAKPNANADGELIGQSAVDLIYQLISDVAFDPYATAANERGFLDSFNFPHLTSVKQIPAGDFARLKNALLDKKSRLAQRAANSQTRTGVAA
jgi:hypothetical protein